MKRTAIIPGLLLGFLLVLLPEGSLPSATGTGDICTTALSEWEKLADTSMAVPQFFMEGQLDIDRMLICDRGFFFFEAREWGRVVRFCLAYHRPTQEEMAKYHGRDETAVEKRVEKVLTATAEANLAYDEFESKIRDTMGKKYVRNRLLSFEKERWQPRIEMKIGQPIEFTWRHRTMSFLALLDIYSAPQSNISPWIILLLLYPGRL